MFHSLTDELLDLQASEVGVRHARLALQLTLCCSCCCCICTSGC